MSEDIRAVLDLKEAQAAPGDSKATRSFLAVAGLVLTVLALINLLIAAWAILSGSHRVGENVGGLLILGGLGFGVLALLVSVAAVLHIACSGGRRHGYGWVGFSFGLIVLAAVVFSAVACQWADRFFKLW